MSQVNVYMNFPGNCREAFEFYKSVFGGEFDMVSTYGDAEEGACMQGLSDESRQKIMHISLPIVENMTIMGTDHVDGQGPEVQMGNHLSFSLNVDTEAEATKYFEALSAGGQILMPLEDTFWGAYFGMCVDKYGFQWMVNFQREEPVS